MNRRALLPFLAFALTHIADADVVFSGYSRVGTQTRYVLTNTTSGKSSDWLNVGDVFEGFTIVGFDQKNETLSVRNGGRIVILPLKPDSVVAAQRKENAAPPRIVLRLLTDGSLEDPVAARRQLMDLKAAHDKVQVELQQPKECNEFKKAVHLLYGLEAEVGIKIVNLRVVKDAR